MIYFDIPTRLPKFKRLIILSFGVIVEQIELSISDEMLNASHFENKSFIVFKKVKPMSAI